MDAVLKAAEDRQRARAIYEFDLPEDLILLEDPWIKKTVGFSKLKMSEERKSIERAKGDPTQVGFFMVMSSLVEVDGRPVNKGEGEEETILENVDPAIRSFMVEAYSQISTGKEGAQKKALAAPRTKV